MIIEFGAKNFFSFKEGVEVSFRHPKNPPSNLNCDWPASALLAVKGGNASGKTNLLKIIPFISYFCISSWSEKPENMIPFASFFNNDEPSCFYLTFDVKGVVYTYELEATPNKVIREAIYRTVQRETLIIERKGNEITKKLSSIKGLKAVTLRDNASLISTLRQYKISYFDEIHYALSNVNGNINKFGRVNDESFDLSDISKILNENEDLKNFTKSMLRSADQDLIDFKIKEISDENGVTSYYPIFQHKIEKDENHWLNFNVQSSGLKALFMNLFRYELVLSEGGCLVMDEFDTHLHPDVLPLLLSLFSDAKVNEKRAQIIFSAHNSETLNSLHKYQLILTSKEYSKCFAYRVDELSSELVRPDRSLRRIYESGKIGGRPCINKIPTSVS